MTFEQVFNKITKNLFANIFDYMENKIYIDDLILACQLLIDYLRFYDNYINI